MREATEVEKRRRSKKLKAEVRGRKCEEEQRATGILSV